MPRACDRCCSLKSQCDGVPCARCNRLGLHCAEDRPARPRGRPRKTGSIGTIERRIIQTVTSPSIGPSSPATRPSLTSEADVGENSFAIEGGTAGIVADDVDDTTLATRLVSDEDELCNTSAGGAIHAQSAVTQRLTPRSNEDSPDNHGAWQAATTLCQVYSRDEGVLPPSGPVQVPTIYSESLGASSPEGNFPPFTTSFAAPSSPHRPLAELGALGFNESIAFAILDHLFTHALDLGLTTILHELQLSATAAMQCFYGNNHPLCPPELTMALLAMAMEFYPSFIPLDVMLKRDIIIDTLRIEFLKRVPVLTWKSSDVNHYQALALSLASFTWCHNSHLSAVGSQWNGIAMLLLKALRQPQTHQSVNGTNLQERFEQIAQDQNTVLMLVHGDSQDASTKGSRNLKQNRRGFDEAYDEQYSGYSEPGTGSETHYLSLFTPLFKFLRRSCELSAFGPLLEAKSIRDDLEDYFISFPPQLLEYASLTFLYQAEAMLWFHGIFLVTFVGRSTPHIISSSGLLDDPSFYSGLEHALLIGEILPTLALLNNGLTALSPATVYFIILSSSVIAGSLWLHHDQLNDDWATYLGSELPDTLRRTVETFCETLGLLCQSDGRYNTAILGELRQLLHILSEGVDAQQRPRLQTSLQVISSESADGDSRADENPGISLPSLDSERVHEYREAVQTLCSPAVRACRPGCFDLSIQF